MSLRLKFSAHTTIINFSFFIFFFYIPLQLLQIFRKFPSNFFRIPLKFLSSKKFIQNKRVPKFYNSNFEFFYHCCWIKMAPSFQYTCKGSPNVTFVNITSLTNISAIPPPAAINERNTLKLARQCPLPQPIFDHTLKARK